MPEAIEFSNQMPDTGFRMFFDSTLGAWLNIQHPVSGIRYPSIMARVFTVTVIIKCNIFATMD